MLKQKRINALPLSHGNAKTKPALKAPFGADQVVMAAVIAAVIDIYDNGDDNDDGWLGS